MATARGSSIVSCLSTGSQKKTAQLEADEAIKCVEADFQLKIEDKQEQLANFEKKISRAERGLAKYKDLVLESLPEKDQTTYESLMESIESSKLEIGFLERDIITLNERLERRKREILEKLDLQLKKIIVIEEDELNLGCAECDEDKETPNQFNRKLVDEWMETQQQKAVAPPQIPPQNPNNHPVPPPIVNQMPMYVGSGVQNPNMYHGPPNHIFPDPRAAEFNVRPPPPLNHNELFYGAGPHVRDGYGTFPPHSTEFLRNPTPPPPPGSDDEKDRKMIAIMEAQLKLMSAGATGGTPQREVIIKTCVDKDLPIFSGNPGEFNNFKAAYNRTAKKYPYDDAENMTRLMKALKGEAKKKVLHLMANPLNLQRVLDVLEECYGRPEFVLDYLVEKAKACEKIEPHKPATLVAFGDTVDALITNVCSYNKKDYLYNKQLTKELIEKLPALLKSRWFEWRAEDETRETNLLCFSNWLKLKVKAARLQITPSLKPEEDDPSGNRRTKRGPATVNVAASNDSKVKKYCVECSKPGHTLSDCRRFEKKSNSDKWNFVKEKRLCFLCLKSGHRTLDCKSEIECTIDGCDKKHHTILHYSGRKKGSSSSSDKSASESESDEESKVQKSSVASRKASESDDNTTTAGTSIVEGTDGALPIVPVWLKGPKGTVKTYALLDTGASRSLVEEGLAQEIGLKGKQFEFSCRGFGGNLTKQKCSRKVKLDIAGYYHGSRFDQLENVITVDKIGIAPYSMNVKEAKKRWPCLRRFKGRSMREVVPRIIVGSPHRHLTLPREILCSRLEGPVATRTILGWVLEGDLSGKGAGTMYYFNNNSDNRYIPHQNLMNENFGNEDVGTKPFPSIQSIDDDKKALQIMETTIVKVGVQCDIGPETLKTNEDDWPSKKSSCCESTVEVVSSGEVLGIRSSIDDGRGLRAGGEEMVIPQMYKFSSYTRLLRVVRAGLRVSNHWIRRARETLAVTGREVHLPLYYESSGTKICTATEKEIDEAEHHLIKWVQYEVSISGGVDFGPSIPSEVDTRANFFREKWKEAEAIGNLFWDRWTVEYLPTLLKREKWTDQVKPIGAGELMLIVDKQLLRNLWVKAVTTATFPGKDGHVRAVELTTRSFSTKKKSKLKRLLTKLYPLGLVVGKSAVMTSNLGAGVEKDASLVEDDT